MVPSDEKKFVIKQEFEDVKKMKGYLRGEQVYHYNVPWRVFIVKYNAFYGIHLQCLKSIETEFFLETSAELKFFRTTGEETVSRRNMSFSHDQGVNYPKLIQLSSEDLEKYLVDGNLAIEVTVIINKMSGIRMEKLRNFDESTKEFSDIVLIVKEEKFYVLKKFLASHSSYFKTLLFGNFEESGKSEIELKEIHPWDFQNFLELIHGESTIDDDTITGILQLADFFDSKTAMRRCEEFLVKNSSKNLKDKFEFAMKYDMKQLLEKCFSEMKTPADIQSVMPNDQTEDDCRKCNVWKKLLEKSLLINES